MEHRPTFLIVTKHGHLVARTPHQYQVEGLQRQHTDRDWSYPGEIYDVPQCLPGFEVELEFDLGILGRKWGSVAYTVQRNALDIHQIKIYGVWINRAHYEIERIDPAGLAAIALQIEVDLDENVLADETAPAVDYTGERAA